MAVEGQCSAAAMRCRVRSYVTHGLTCMDLSSVMNHSTMEACASSPCCRQVCLSCSYLGVLSICGLIVEAVDAAALVTADGLT